MQQTFEQLEAQALRFGEARANAGPHSQLVCNDRGRWSREWTTGTNPTPVPLGRATAQGLFNRYNR